MLQKAREMFTFGYDGYMQYAFPLVGLIFFFFNYVSMLQWMFLLLGRTGSYPLCWSWPWCPWPLQHQHQRRPGGFFTLSGEWNQSKKPELCIQVCCTSQYMHTLTIFCDRSIHWEHWLWWETLPSSSVLSNKLSTTSHLTNRPPSKFSKPTSGFLGASCQVIVNLAAVLCFTLS